MTSNVIPRDSFILPNRSRETVWTTINIDVFKSLPVDQTHMTHDTWHTTHDTQHMIHDTWHMTHDTRHMAHGTWHMAHDTDTDIDTYTDTDTEQNRT